MEYSGTSDAASYERQPEINRAILASEKLASLPSSRHLIAHDRRLRKLERQIARLIAVEPLVLRLERQVERLTTRSEPKKGRKSAARGSAPRTSTNP